MVGKLGRVESPLDPAPVSMIETLINYTSEFLVDGNGNPALFRFVPEDLDLFRGLDGRPLPAAGRQILPRTGSFCAG